MVVEYDIGDGVQRMIENRRNFSDGQYHVVRFIRTGHNATLRVDDYPHKHKNPVGKYTGEFIYAPLGQH